jgi:diguanylate cyclase (GGDEF)-like protein
MDKSSIEIPARRLLFIAVLGICSSLILFILLITIFGGQMFGWCIAMASLAGVLTAVAALTILYYSAYKKSIQSIIKLKEQSSTDKLTELYNRSFLEPFLDHEINKARKEKLNISVMMVDLDHFKEINDTYGHIVGDHILSIFAQVVLKCIRKTDIIARYGGDEFVVVLPKTDTDTAKIIADRIRLEVSGTYIPPVDDILISSIHCSVGISTYPLHCDSKNSLIKTSDLALYMAKRSGRNCTRVYEREPIPG